MNDILQKICRSALARTQRESAAVPLCEVMEAARHSSCRGEVFFDALSCEGLAVIAEIKKASPSRGIIDERFDYLSAAADYERGGAAAVSCLTEPEYFLGSDKIFSEVRAACQLPMLRKDFILTEYQVYRSAAMSADCILLIMSALGGDRAKELYVLARSLGMEALFECRDERQIELAQKAGGRIIGVNNRNLADFSVEHGRAARMRSLVDKSNIFVSESGIMSPGDAREQKEAGADAVLVGEYLMRALNRQAAVRELKNV